jgi:hypothetical protein
MKKIPNITELFYILEMLESSLIDYRFTRPWAAQIAEQNSEMPTWIKVFVEEKHTGTIKETLWEYLKSGLEAKAPDDLEKFHVGCLWLRYERRELSWASFLNETGRYLDAVNGDWFCETPYQYLNIHEDENFSVESEAKTKEEYRFEQDLTSWIELAYEKYDRFRKARIKG